MDSARIASQDSDRVIACALTGEKMGAQAQRWLRLGQDAGLGRTETEDGLRIRFRDDPAVERELRALVAVESACCSWATWDVHRARGELVLHVHAPGPGAAALHAMFSAGSVSAIRPGSRTGVSSQPD